MESKNQLLLAHWKMISHVHVCISSLNLKVSPTGGCVCSWIHWWFWSQLHHRTASEHTATKELILKLNTKVQCPLLTPFSLVSFLQTPLTRHYSVLPHLSLLFFGTPPSSSALWPGTPKCFSLCRAILILLVSNLPKAHLFGSRWCSEVLC